MAAKMSVFLLLLQVIIFQVAFEKANSLPQDSMQWLFDTKAFDDKHQRALLPTNLFTGITYYVVGKMHEDVQKYAKKTELEDDQTTTVQPKITDSIVKIKKRSAHSDEEEDINCGCKGDVSIADGIAEHFAEHQNNEKKTSTDLELEEGASLKTKSTKVTKT